MHVRISGTSMLIYLAYFEGTMAHANDLESKSDLLWPTLPSCVMWVP